MICSLLLSGFAIKKLLKRSYTSFSSEYFFSAEDAAAEGAPAEDAAAAEGAPAEGAPAEDAAAAAEGAPAEGAPAEGAPWLSATGNFLIINTGFLGNVSCCKWL